MAETQVLWQKTNAVNLIEKMLSGDIIEIKPALSLSSELGFSYPQIEELLAMNAEQVAEVLESLATDGILAKRFSDKILLCHYCRSANLRPSLRCPKCGSGFVDKARLLEHYNCGHVDVESEFIGNGKYVCPQCHRELKFLGTDYRSLGIKYKCTNCNEIFSDPVFKWQCLGCLLLFAENEAKEIPLYTYYLNESRRSALEFEVGPKKKLIALLQSHGYEIEERGLIVGKSKAEHIFDIIASRTDGLWTHTLVIDTLMDDEKEVTLEKVFRFDDKAYDAGIHDKVLVVFAKLTEEAYQFAKRQRIRVLSGEDLESLLVSGKPVTKRQAGDQPFAFQSMPQFIKWLKDLGYSIKEKAKVWGRSGVPYVIDILAEWDDSIIRHSVGIGTVTAEAEVSLEAVALFDSMGYDIGLDEKVLLVAPKLSDPAKHFAERQRVKVIEIKDVRKLG